MYKACKNSYFSALFTKNIPVFTARNQAFLRMPIFLKCDPFLQKLFRGGHSCHFNRLLKK